jgi:uncharacterized protein (TIGR02117 family)
MTAHSPVLPLLPLLKLFTTLLVALSLAACTGAPLASESPRSAAQWQGRYKVLLVSNGWHTGVVLAGADVLAETIPEVADFPNAAWVEFGWGDREYYPAESPGITMAFSALFQPTPAIMHVTGYTAEPSERYPQADIVTLGLSNGAIARLLSFIAGSFERLEGGGLMARVQASGPGLYRDSLFYPARGSFSLSNTCNTWAAKALAAAGVPVQPHDVSTAADLMREAQAAGAVVVR